VTGQFVNSVVGRHDALRAGADRSAEWRQVEPAQCPFANRRSRHVAPELGCGVDVVTQFGRCGFGMVHARATHAADHGRRQFAHEPRVFAEAFAAPAPARVARQVADRGAQTVHAVGPGGPGRGLADRFQEIHIESGAQADRLGMGHIPFTAMAVRRVGQHQRRDAQARVVTQPMLDLVGQLRRATEVVEVADPLPRDTGRYPAVLKAAHRARCAVAERCRDPLGIEIAIRRHPRPHTRSPIHLDPGINRGLPDFLRQRHLGKEVRYTFLHRQCRVLPLWFHINNVFFVDSFIK